MKINFLLRIRGFFVITILALSIWFFGATFFRNDLVFGLFAFLLFLYAFIYIPTFIYFALNNYFRNRRHEPFVLDFEGMPEVDKKGNLIPKYPKDHLLKYSFGVLFTSILVFSIFYIPETPEEIEQREKEEWAQKRIRGAPLLSDQELLENQINYICYTQDRTIGRLYDACKERNLASFSAKNLNMTRREKEIESINYWCIHWKKLGYESEEICEKEQMESYGIKH